MNRERPILFSAPMVRAILDGRKTQTRRVVKPQPWAEAEMSQQSRCSPEGWQIGGDSGIWHDETGDIFENWRCPYGVPGDRLWVRETCRAEELSRPPTERLATRKERLAYGRTTVVELNELDGFDGVRYPADDAWQKIENSQEAADRWLELLHYGKKPPSKGLGNLVPAIHMPRWASRITLEITGVRVERLHECSEADAIAEGAFLMANGFWNTSAGGPSASRAIFAYRNLWNAINGEGSWAANPWVWVVEFKRIETATAAAA